ncbi:MAG: ATP-binding protein [Candidatus Margulisiibacteriota bacterium]
MQLYIAFNSLILLVTLVINLLLAFYVIHENRRSEANWAFAGTLLSVVVWILTILMFLQVPSPGLVLLFRRLTPIGSSLVAGFLLYFSLVFPRREEPLLNYQRILCLLPGVTFSLLAIFSPLMVQGFIVQDLHYLFIGQPIWGPVYKFFAIYFVGYYLAGIYNLTCSYYKAQATDKLQIWYVLVGFVLSGVSGVIFSLLLPMIGITDTFTLGPIFTLFLAFFVSYAIVRHGLLNTEDFLTRSVVILAVMAGIVGTFWATLTNDLRFLVSFYITLANASLGLVVLARNYRSNINRSFAALAFCLAVWAFCVFKAWSASTEPQALFWIRACFLGPAFPGLLWYFSLVFPREENKIKWPQFLIMFLPSVIFVPLIFSPLIIEKAEKMTWGYNALSGPLYYIFAMFLAAYFLLGFMNLANKLFKAKGIEKIQIRYVFVGFLLTILAGLVTNLMILGIFENAQYTWVGPYSTIFFVGFSTYAIVRHRLLSIELVIQKGFVYVLSTAIITVVYVFIVYLSEQLFRETFGYSSAVLITLAALLIAVAYQPVVQFIQRLTDNLFFRSRLDYQKTLQEASEAIASVIKLEDISGLVARVFAGALNVKEISLVILDPIRHKYRSAPLPNIPESGKYIKIEIDSNNAAVQLLRDRKEILVSYELERELASLSSAESVRLRREQLRDALEEMTKLEVMVWVPIIGKDELAGFIAMGEKESGEVFTADDLSLFSVLASQIAVALENARLYEEVLTMKNYNEDILQSMTDGVLTTDLRGNIITFNKMAEKISGLTIAQVIGKSCEEIFGVGSPFSTLVEKVLRGRSRLQIETNLMNPQVGWVPVSVQANLLRDSAGKKMGILLVLADLTQLKELESKVRQADKLAALGTMAAGMAHEIKNPLSSMKVLSQLMPLKFDDPEFRGKFQEIMPKEISRIDRIVENLLGFARASAPKFEKVKIESVLEETLDYFSGQLETAKVKLVKKTEKLPEVVADAAQLAQVFSNLILNAIQAMPAGGELSIAALPGKTMDGELAEVVVSFADTGCGMAPEQLNKLFEPFFTTKYGGTGLGLTISHSIIEGHGGSINVKSTPGKGTTFIVTLPVMH